MGGETSALFLGVALVTEIANKVIGLVACHGGLLVRVVEALTELGRFEEGACGVAVGVLLEISILVLVEVLGLLLGDWVERHQLVERLLRGGVETRWFGWQIIEGLRSAVSTPVVL